MSATQPISQKELILSLLEADLRNAKLINGLNAAGAVVSDFYTDLCTTVFKLLDFPPEEQGNELYDLYLNFLFDFSKRPNTEFLKSLREMSLEIYNALLIQRHNIRLL